MILGIDLGNFSTKVSNGLIFPSKCSKTPSLLKSTCLSTEEGNCYIGEGNFDTEYRKVKKEYLRQLFLYACLPETNVKAVVGLPLSQYKSDRSDLKALLSQRVNDIALDGIPRRIVVEDAEVYPEGVASVYGTEFSGLIVDIGGRTTDVCEYSGGKVTNPFSLPAGTMNLYSDFIKVLNSHGLDLKPEDADRILKNGLKIDGEQVDVTGAMEVFRSFVNSLVSQLQVEYPLHTHDVLLIGGGCQLLYTALKNRMPAARLINNPVFANAIGFGKVGHDLWP